MEESIESQDIDDGCQRIMPFEDDGLRLRELTGNERFLGNVQCIYKIPMFYSRKMHMG